MNKRRINKYTEEQKAEFYKKVQEAIANGVPIRTAISGSGWYDGGYYSYRKELKEREQGVKKAIQEKAKEVIPTIPPYMQPDETVETLVEIIKGQMVGVARTLDALVKFARRAK